MKKNLKKIEDQPRKRDLAKPIIIALFFILIINAIGNHQPNSQPSVSMIKNTAHKQQITPKNEPPQANVPTPPPSVSADENYKNKIIADSLNTNYKIENLTSIAGPQELSNFILANNANPITYTPSYDNITYGRFKANLHNHTLNSDGTLSVKEFLDQAQSYAQRARVNPFYIAITDHNTVEGLKQAVDILLTNPDRYKNLKVVLGVELNSTFDPGSTIVKQPVKIHVLCWAVNPFDGDLNQILMNKNTITYDQNFSNVISTFRTKGIVGIAHPMRYVTYDNMVAGKVPYYQALISTYTQSNSGGMMFTEGYYQSYTTKDETDHLKDINDMFQRSGLVLTGSTDTHGRSIFKR